MVSLEKIKSNFIYPDLKPEHYRFGSDKIIGTILRRDGNWSDYLPPFETQERNQIESSACFVEALQHAIATIQEEQFNIKDLNYSARFNALLSGGTEYGGSPIEGIQSIRHDGLIKDSSMPFSDDIQSWSDFHSWKGIDETQCRNEGQQSLKNWKINYDIVFEREDTIEQKYDNLREALKYSPVPMSVFAWYEDNGIYRKPEGVRDNHFVECVYLDDDNKPYILDTYYPFLKRLEPFYNSEFAMRLSVSKLEQIKKKNWFQLFIQWLLQEKLIYRLFKISMIKYYNEKFNKMVR